MGTKIKEINTYSFIGSLGGEKKKSEMKEIDEELDIINCKDKFDRECLLLKALEILKRELPGESAETRQIPVLINDEVRIEMITTGSPSDGDTSGNGKGQHEVQVQVENKCTTRTDRGDFELSVGDLLVVPAEVNHKNTGQAGTSRLLIYTKKPLQVAKGFPVQGEERDMIFLKPTEVLDQVEEGPSGGKHFELVENEDLMVETTIRSDSQRIYHRGFNQDEIAFQVTGRRATRTNQGEFMLETGDLLCIPPGCSHRNVGDMLTTRIIMYTRNPLRVADEFNERVQKVEELKPRKAS